MPYHPRSDGGHVNGDIIVYPVFTVYLDRVERGAVVEIIRRKDDGAEIPGIRVGENGRGRKEAVLPITGLPGELRDVEYLGLTGCRQWRRPPLRQKAIVGGKEDNRGYVGHYATTPTLTSDAGAAAAILVYRLTVPDDVSARPPELADTARLHQESSCIMVTRRLTASMLVMSLIVVHRAVLFYRRMHLCLIS